MTTPITEPTQGTTPNSTQEKNNLASGQKGTQLVETIPIENEPFIILKWDEKYYLCLGKYRLTEALDSEEEAREQVYNVSWYRLLQVMHAVVAEEIHAHRQQKGDTNL